MQSKPKSNSVVTSNWVNETQLLVIGVLGAGQITFDPAKASQSCRDYAMIHGFTQRLSNASAIPKRDGISASPQEKYEAIMRLREHYESGTEEWELASRPRGPQIDQWAVRAVAALKGIDYATALQMALDAAQLRKASIVDVVAAWGRIRAIGDKAAELRAQASGVTAEQVGEWEKELNIPNGNEVSEGAGASEEGAEAAIESAIEAE